METARRYSGGKLRYELIPTSFKKELAKIYTMGAEKYSVKNDKGEIIEDGSNNWRKGMSWMQCLSSIFRHLEKFEDGLDHDHDFPKEILDKYGPSFHLANAAWGLATLIEYYTTHPEFDDRPHRILPKPKITVDLDDVCCKFVEGWCKLNNCEIPNSWQFDRAIRTKLTTMESEGRLNDFYLNLEPKIDPRDLTFEPLAYITARPVKSEISEMWLDKHGFPAAPVYTVGVGGSKLDIIQKLGATIHIDDNYDTYTELNQNGICCYLLDALHNQKFDVGIRRLKSLKDLKI